MWPNCLWRSADLGKSINLAGGRWGNKATTAFKGWLGKIIYLRHDSALQKVGMIFSLMQRSSLAWAVNSKVSLLLISLDDIALDSVFVA